MPYTEDWVTKSTTETRSPEWASTNAWNHVPAASLRIWTTWVKTTESSSLTRYSIVAGCSLNFPSRAASALAIAASTVMVGLEEAMVSVDRRMRKEFLS